MRLESDEKNIIYLVMKIIDYNKKKPRLCYGNVCFITSQKIWISIFIQIACDWICIGQNTSPKFTQAYTAYEFFTVICQNEYLIIAGVLYPTTSSRNNICKFLCLRRSSSYRSAARYQPLSCTKVSSARRFIVIGLPHFGQCGISSVGIRIFFCVFSISWMHASLS